MKKRIRIIVAILILAVGGYYFYQQKQNKTEEVKDKKEVIKIGAILPLTGKYALYGQNDKKGIDLALSQIDTSKYSIEVVYEDNKGTAKDAVSAMEKLKEKGVFAIIDDAISSITLSIVPIADKYHIPIISTGATNPKLSGISKYFFRIWNSDTEEGRFAAIAAINKLHSKSASIIYINTDYGLGLMDVFKKEYSKMGGEIIDVIPFDEKTINYKNIIPKIHFNKIDLLYIVGYAPQTGIITKTIYEYKKHPTILSTVATEDPTFLKLAGEAANGVYYVYNADVQNDERKEFVQHYTKKYKEDPQILTDVGYDAMMIIIHAIEKNKIKNGDDLVRYLNTMESYNGASGLIKFDKNGDVHKPMTLKIILNNEFIKYE